MAIEAIGLDQIRDNPYQARLTYHRKDIDELAHSIKTHGLLQVPPGRRVDGKVELGFGHLRKRAFVKLAKKEPEKWGKMPVDIRVLTDEQMALFALEENLKRRNITPLETARAVDHYLNSFLEKTEVEIAESLNMTKGNVSNMRRVLRLPEKFLEKIDEGIITFTQGRELLTLEGLPDAEELMSSALAGINTTGNKLYSKPNTVEGLQQSIHSVINNKFPPLDKEWEGYRYNLLFDTRSAGCLECDKMIRTHPNKSATAHYCTDAECWDKKQEEHKALAAAAARAKMEAEVLERAAKDVAQRAPEPGPDISQKSAAAAYKMEKRGTSWIALDGQGVVIAIDSKKENADTGAVAYFSPVVTKVDPKTSEYVLNHTYRISRRFELRKPDDIFDVTAQDLATAITALGVKTEDIEAVRVYKSSGKLGTGGGVSAGWSKCTEPLDDLAQVEEQLEEQADEGDRQMEEARERANLERPVGELPCETCTFGNTCGREGFRVDGEEGGRYICDEWEPNHVPRASENLQEISRRIAGAPAPPQEVPNDILTLAKEKAGTRAEVLDLTDICSGKESWSRQMKSGYVLLSDELRLVDEPEECLERCTHGFHYAFDSKAKEQKEICVCSDPKCLAQKKGALTRKKNADGLARKNTERKAIQEAIAGADRHPRGVLMLLLYAQVKGKHITTYYSGDKGKAPEKWLWDKVSAGTKETDRTLDKLMAKLDKLEESELRKLLLEMMFYYLTDHGDTGSYQVKTELPLRLMGVDIQRESKEEVANV